MSCEAKMDVGLASTEKNAKMNEFWMTVMTEINQSASLDKHHELPMARIKTRNFLE